MDIYFNYFKSFETWILWVGVQGLVDFAQRMWKMAKLKQVNWVTIARVFKNQTVVYGVCPCVFSFNSNYSIHDQTWLQLPTA